MCISILFIFIGTFNISCGKPDPSSGGTKGKIKKLSIEEAKKIAKNYDIPTEGKPDEQIQKDVNKKIEEYTELLKNNIKSVTDEELKELGLNEENISKSNIQKVMSDEKKTVKFKSVIAHIKKYGGGVIAHIKKYGGGDEDEVETKILKQYKSYKTAIKGKEEKFYNYAKNKYSNIFTGKKIKDLKSLKESKELNNLKTAVSDFNEFEKYKSSINIIKGKKEKFYKYAKGKHSNIFTDKKEVKDFESLKKIKKLKDFETAVSNFKSFNNKITDNEILAKKAAIIEKLKELAQNNDQEAKDLVALISNKDLSNVEFESEEQKQKIRNVYKLIAPGSSSSAPNKYRSQINIIKSNFGISDDNVKAIKATLTNDVIEGLVADNKNKKENTDILSKGLIIALLAGDVKLIKTICNYSKGNTLNEIIKIKQKVGDEK